jgi:hypothetical protein
LVSLPVHAAAGGGVFFDTLREAAITRTIDGSLVVNSSSMGVGLGFYMIPLAMYFESWAIYRAATPTGMERGSK